MTNFKNNKVSTVTKEIDHDLIWSFKPLNTLLKLLTGIGLSGKGKYHKKWSLYGILMISVTLLTQCMWFTELYYMVTGPRQEETNTYLVSYSKDDIISDSIEYCFTAFYQIGVHFILFSIAYFTQHWCHLWEKVEEIHSELQLSKMLYLKCRKVAITLGSIVLFEEILLYGLKFSTRSFWDDYPVMRVLLRVGDSFSKLITASVFVLIVTVIISVMFLLKTLGEKMDLLNLNLNGAEIKLIQWKKQHLLVTQFVDRINDCFGGIIFLVVFHGFVCLIYYFNSIFHSTSHGGDIVWNTLTICMLASKLFRLTLIIYVCYLMQYQGTELAKKVVRFNAPCNEEMHLSVTSVVASVLYNLPSINAGGFFEVNLVVLPTLAGMIVTCLIVLSDNSKKSHGDINDTNLNLNISNI